MPERGIDCMGFAVCCRTSSFAIPFSLGGMRPDGVGILWKRFRAPRSGHLARIHSHLLT